MAKAAIVILAGNDTHADLGRLVNGLETAREFAETDGDEVRVVFDGAGTTWIPELEDPDSDQHELYEAVRDAVTVCDFCANAFEVHDDVLAAGVELGDAHDGHPSIRSMVADGYEVITF